MDVKHTLNHRADRLKTFSPQSVWTEFTPLAQKYQAVNLGQGFPDFPADDFVTKAAQDAISSHLNQYTRSMGHLRLVNALSAFYSPRFNRTIDPMTEIVTTMGATEALYAAITAVVNPGEEVLLIEPFYDSYPVDTIMAGGIPKYIPLRFQQNGKSASSSAEYKLDLKELESKITPKTRLLIVNTPQNIPGKVYSEEELHGIAALCQKHNLFVISDEVYEPMVYDNQKHVSLGAIPGMWDRTITIGSAGKSFSVTGWKTGWVMTSKSLAEAIWIVHQNTTFSSNTPMQEAIAVAFEQILRGPEQYQRYFDDMRATFQKKRDLLCKILKEAGLEPIVPQGSYFVLADTRKIPTSVFMDPNDSASRDYQFCRWLVREIGVAAIPPTAFYSPEDSHLAEHLARFCFCKKEETIIEAGKRLQKLKQFQ